MTDPVRFGIVSTGKIARSFADDFPKVVGAELVAVASRTEASARAFADDVGIERAYGGYEQMAADPDVDAVYVATPHSRHADDTCLFLEAGKHVLCEKPFAINRAEAARMIDTAVAHDRLLMEAMWARFSPAWNVARERLAAGAIGAPRLITAEFCFPTVETREHRLRDPARGGGSLLDLGVYPLGFAWFLLGEPDTIDARGVLVDGVDTSTSMLATWADGTHARLHTSIDAALSIGASVLGHDGTITLDEPFHASGRVIVDGPDGHEEIETVDNGLHHQASHFVEQINRGARESDVVPHAYTLAMMGRLDEVRSAIGLQYPDHD